MSSDLLQVPSDRPPAVTTVVPDLVSPSCPVRARTTNWVLRPRQTLGGVGRAPFRLYLFSLISVHLWTKVPYPVF